LLTQLQSVGDLVTRISRFQLLGSEENHESTTNIEAPPVLMPEEAGPISMLQQLAERVASENDKQAVVQCIGFEEIPESYRRVIKDISVQAVRNAIVHGIESPQVREAVGKSLEGTVRLEFQNLDQGGYKFIIEDDGQGLSSDRIKEAAVNKGFLSAEEAAILDPKQTFSLLFRSGFSTMETTTKDAGRGVGMNIVAELMREVGGRIAVATAVGKFTRLTLTLPRAVRETDDTEAA